MITIAWHRNEIQVQGNIMNKTHVVTSYVRSAVILLLSAGFVLVQGCSSSGGESSAVIVTFTDAVTVEGDSGTTDLVFTASISSPVTSAVSIDYTTVDETAIAGSDYVAVTDTLQIAAGSTSASITITISGDTEIESDETFGLNLSNVTGASLGSTRLTGTISTDDHANPSAYYTGGATVKDPDNIANDLVFNDLHVMVSGNRIMMMSVSNVLLYDAQITNISGSDFTADVTIYTGMATFPVDPVITTTITGTITEGSRIEGTIEGTGAATGTFVADYSSLSTTPAASANIAQEWTGLVNGLSDRFRFTLDGLGVITPYTLTLIDGVFDSCRLSGSISSISSESLYFVDIDMTNCLEFPVDGNYTGFAIPGSLAFDTLLIAFSDGDTSGISELTVIP